MPSLDNSLYKDWTDVSIKEISIYLGLIILFGIFKLPQLYWSPNQVFSAPMIPKFMLIRQFCQINSFFHAFNYNSLSVKNEDRLIKMRHVVDFFLRKFKEVYTPDKHFSLDDGILAYKGKLSFKVYNKDKPSKYGIKLYILE